MKPRAPRFFDENFGPFFLFLIGMVRKGWRSLMQASPPRVDQVHSIALLKLGDLTETVLMSGLVGDLKKWKPNVQITLIVGPGNSAYADLIPLVDHLLMLPAQELGASLSQIRKEKFDLLFNLDPWSRVSAILGALSHSRWVVGFMTPRESRHFADDHLVPHRRDIHELDNYRALLRSAGIQGAMPPLKPETQVSNTIIEAITLNLWAEGENSHLREWQLDRWKRLIVLLSERGAYTFYLAGSPDQRGRNQVLIDQLPIALRARVTNAAGGTMDQIVRLIASSQVFVSIDTGFAHVAAATGIPVVALHGPTHPKRWGAVGPQVQHLMSRLPGAGQVHLGFDYGSQQNFLDGITVEEVYGKVEKAIGLRGGPFIQEFEE
jgi:heptosyltransferase-3